MTTTLEIKGGKLGFNKLEEKLLRKIVPDIRAVQLEQIANAFRDRGQPGAKWKPLWADKFQGKTKQSALDAAAKASAAYAKALDKTKKTIKGSEAIRNLKKRQNDLQLKKSQDRVNNAAEKLNPSTSYRKGGSPLRDTGALMGSFFTKYAFVFGSDALVVVASSNPVAPWHQKGFKTKGPNFIPLTRKAKRDHSLGVNPEWEGLVQGVDYIMAWQGVDVPSRPMIDYADPVNKKMIQDAIRLAIQRSL
jgi:phage gpG-like protein